MTKINNSFTLVGRVTRIQDFANRDGSLTRLINIATSTGKDRTDFVDCERFIPFVPASGCLKPDVTDHLTIGSRLVASGYLTNVSFADKFTGERKYKTAIRVSHVSLLDSKAETQALRIRNADKAAQKASKARNPYIQEGWTPSSQAAHAQRSQQTTAPRHPQSLQMAYQTGSVHPAASANPYA